MKNLQLYKILSYILLPFGGLFAVVALFGILVALGNPLMLISLFFIACVALYIFSSFKFFNKGIIQQIKCKPSLKDFVRVNSFVSIFFGLYTLASAVIALYHPEMIKPAIQQMMTMPQFSAQPGLTEEGILKVFKISYLIMSCFAVILLIHNYFSLIFLTRYKNLFTEE